MGAQSLCQPVWRLCRAAVKDGAVGIEDNCPPVLSLGNASQKRILLADPSKPEADIDGLVNGRMQALHA